CEEYLNNWKRAQADFENYKKDEAERVGNLLKYAKEDVILGVLEIADHIHFAKKHIPDNIKQDKWTEGFLQIEKQIADFLKKEGVEEIKIKGNGFDPNTMEVIEEVEGEEPGKIAEEVQKGYVMEGKVIRPSKVKVFKQ
ncbi:MAG: nucleotide exchange factor GrpE, partial [Patescibacteria group bacterium]